MALYRGFQTEAKAVAQEVRAELRLTPYTRLDPFLLAEHLGVHVTPLSALQNDTPFGTNHFTTVEPDTFSAVTVFRGTRRHVVHNDCHSPGRQASDIVHELSHALLHHPPTAAMDDHGCRLWDQSVEDEAEFLAGVLLVPDEAALRIARTGVLLEQAAMHYGVSIQMVHYRLNKSGARLRVKRERLLWH